MQGLAVARIETDRLVVVGDRAPVVPFGRVGEGAIVESDRKLWIDAKHPGVIRDGAVVVLLVVISETATQIGFGVIGIDADRRREVCDRAIVVLGCVMPARLLVGR